MGIDWPWIRSFNVPYEMLSSCAYVFLWDCKLGYGLFLMGDGYRNEATIWNFCRHFVCAVRARKVLHA